jgi:hypothetical protein
MQKSILAFILFLLSLNALGQKTEAKDQLNAINQQEKTTYSFFKLVQDGNALKAINLIDTCLRAQGVSYDLLQNISNAVNPHLDSAKLLVTNYGIKNGVTTYKCEYRTIRQAIFLCYVTYKEGQAEGLIQKISLATDTELSQYNSRKQKFN